MKETTLYQCEICGTQYASERAAIECEQSHRTIKEVVAQKYRSFKSNPDGYPDVISVTFDNDKKVTYKR